jgi:hypothetical protein
MDIQLVSQAIFTLAEFGKRRILGGIMQECADRLTLVPTMLDDDR